MAYQQISTPQVDRQFRQEPQRLRHEFHIENIGLYHHAPEDFVRSQWQSGPTSSWFLAYRWVMAVFFGAGCISYMIIYFNNGFWFLYLTNWGFLLCSVTSLSGAILVTWYNLSPADVVNQSGLIQCYWACYWINLINAHIVSVIFWTVIFPVNSSRAALIKLHPIFEVWVHVMPPLLFTLDHMIVAQPTRLLHCVYPFGFGLFYLGFAFVYYMLGGLNPNGKKYIYYFLNFKKPLKSLKGILLITALCILSSTLQYGLYRLKVFIARKLGKLQ